MGTQSGAKSILESLFGLKNSRSQTSRPFGKAVARLEGSGLVPRAVQDMNLPTHGTLAEDEGGYGGGPGCRISQGNM